jgi:tetratricopeptide (TPR) repeat protein
MNELYKGIRSLKNGKLDKALGHFQMMQAADPDSPSTYYYLGETLRQQGSLAAAKTMLSHAADLFATFNPSEEGKPRKRSKIILLFQARLYRDLGEVDRALSILDELVYSTEIEIARCGDHEHFAIIKQIREEADDLKKISKQEAFCILNKMITEKLFAASV